MRIGFFGTPGISSFCLESLIERFDVVFAVTGEDKPSGRHRAVRCCPAKDCAENAGIPVYHPAELTDDAFITKLQGHNADIFVVVAYGRIIPRSVFDIPRLKTINLHPSLLPKYRGAAPIQWALINGETVSGISVQMINERLDAGDIILQEIINLHSDMTAGDLYDIVLPKGAEMLAEAVVLLDSGTASPQKQNEEEATYCGKIDKELPRIRWEKSSDEIHNLVRGLNPRPGTWTTYRSMQLKIWKTSPFTEAEIELKPAELHVYQRKRLLVGTGNGCLELLSIQPERKRAMDGLSFINGYRIKENDTLE